MNNPSYKAVSGFSLVFVLISISVLSALLIHYSYMHKVQEDRRAFEYTLAQLQNILNLANAYRVRNNHWPRNSDDDCVVPSQVISGMSEHTNGWGYDIVATGNCSDGSSTYTLSQKVPDDYYDLIRSLLNEDITSAGVVSGLRTMRVRVEAQDMNGGVLVEFGELSNSHLIDPLRFSTISCTGGVSEKFFFGFESMCASAVKNIIVPPFIHPDPVVVGFSIVDGWWGSNRTVAYEGYVYDWTKYLDIDLDGYSFASYKCPRNWGNPKAKIDVVYMAWCE